jgi:hypothetical protein
MVVLQGQAGVQNRGHQAAWPILHPPGTVQGCVEGHDEVPVLGAEGPGILSWGQGGWTLPRPHFTSGLLQLALDCTCNPTSGQQVAANDHAGPRFPLLR